MQMWCSGAWFSGGPGSVWCSQSAFPRFSVSMVSGKGVLQVWQHLDSTRGFGVTLNMCSHGQMAVGRKSLSCCKNHRLSLALWSWGLHWCGWKSLKTGSWDAVACSNTAENPGNLDSLIHCLIWPPKNPQGCLSLNIHHPVRLWWAGRKKRFLILFCSMMTDILKAILSKLHVKQANCLICVAPNDKLDYYSWKNFKHLIIYTSSPGLFAFHTSVSVDEERSCLCFKVISPVSLSPVSGWCSPGGNHSLQQKLVKMLWWEHSLLH